MLNDIEVFEDFYTLAERENGLPQLTIVNFADGNKQRITYPEPVYTAVPGKTASTKQTSCAMPTSLWSRRLPSLIMTWRNILQRSAEAD